MRKPNGFTLIELMIVVAIIAIIAAIAIPNLLSARLNANETAAVATLRSISSAQAQFQASARADVDSDGQGEYGMFRELSGDVAVRENADGSGSGSPLNPPVLSGAFRTLTEAAEVTRSGYTFKMFLPGAGGLAQEEDNVGDPIDGLVDNELAETTWCTYAWPTSYSTSGNRTFFVNQAGDIVTTDSVAYSGMGALDEASAGAAFVSGSDPGAITARVAVGTVGVDTNRWKQVN